MTGIQSAATTTSAFESPPPDDPRSAIFQGLVPSSPPSVVITASADPDQPRRYAVTAPPWTGEARKSSQNPLRTWVAFLSRSTHGSAGTSGGVNRSKYSAYW